MTVDFIESLFAKPMQIAGVGRLAMLAPLALSIALVLRTVRCRRLSAIPLASLTLAISILGGMMLLGVVLLLIFHFMA